MGYKSRMTLTVLFLIMMYGSVVAPVHAGSSEAEPHILRLREGSGPETEAAFFNGDARRAVVLAPGAMFSKESWYFLGLRLKTMKISSLCLNSGSVPDLENSYSFLIKKGVRHITFVGASIGGTGVLEALQDGVSFRKVKKVVLLAPFGGKPLMNENIDKLFIVAIDDMMSSSAEVYTIYNDSSKPKVYKEYDGSAHAQRLFESEYRKDLIELILDFVNR